MTLWPIHRVQSLLLRFTTLIHPFPMDSEEKTRFLNFAAFLVLGVPTMLLFGILDILHGQPVFGGIVLGVAAVLLIGLYLMRLTRNALVLYRISGVIYAGLLLYMLAVGGEDGSKALWMFTFPPVAFFLVGNWEGFWWNSAMLTGALGIFWFLPGRLPVHPYRGEFIARLLASYFIVSVIAYWFEYLRQHYRAEMESRQAHLEEERAALLQAMEWRLEAEREKEVVILELRGALSQVKQLSGMLPICASCKKIRDDRGYWKQLESYIREHSEAEFSHGLCPDCANHLYPGIYSGR